MSNADDAGCARKKRGLSQNQRNISGAHCRRGFNDDDEAPGDLRSRVGVLAILRDTGKLMMVAPPTFGRWRLLDGNAERRSLQVYGNGVIQRAREVAKWSTRCRSSP
jgi:hypothetical protein